MPVQTIGVIGADTRGGGIDRDDPARNQHTAALKISRGRPLRRWKPQALAR